MDAVTFSEVATGAKQPGSNLLKPMASSRKFYIYLLSNSLREWPDNYLQEPICSQVIQDLITRMAT
jgi:hypothetical protein